MVVSESVLNEIKEKVKLYDDAKEKIKEAISKKIGTAIEKLKIIQSELFDEVEKEFGRNPFAEFLSSINNRTDTDAKRLLAEKKSLKTLDRMKSPFPCFSRKSTLSERGGTNRILLISSQETWKRRMSPATPSHFHGLRSKVTVTASTKSS